MYKCAYCGKEFDAIEDRTKCEFECAKKARAAEEKAEREKLERAKETENKLITDMFDKTMEIIKAYYDRYHELPECLEQSDTFKLFGKFDKLVEHMFDLW